MLIASQAQMQATSASSGSASFTKRIEKQMQASIDEGLSIPPHIARHCLHELRRRTALVDAFKRELKQVKEGDGDGEHVDTIIENDVSCIDVIIAFIQRRVSFRTSLDVISNAACCMNKSYWYIHFAPGDAASIVCVLDG